jgi:hypothetical protein
MRSRLCLATAALMLGLAGCGASQGNYRPGFLPAQNAPGPAVNTRVEGAMPAQEGEGRGVNDDAGARKSKVPNSVMLRDQGAGGYDDSLSPSS